MKIFMYLSQLLIRHVGVNLGGGDVGVAKEGLDGAKIGAVGQQVGGKRVADGMRRHFLGNSGFDGVIFYNSFY